MVGGVDGKSGKLTFLTAAWTQLAGVHEGCAPTVGFCGTPQNSPNAVEGGQGRQLPGDGMQTFLCSFEHREKGFNNHLLKNGATRKTHLIYM